MAERRHDYYLLTPGPLTVSPEVKAEMLRDRSPGAAEHVGITQEIRRYLLEICNGTATHECIPVQGSATFAIEAAFHTLIPQGGKLLVIENGWYGMRLREVAEAIRLPVATLQLPMLPLPTAADVEAVLDADPAITHIAMCHVDTGTGVLNPVPEIAEVARRRGRRLMIDAVAAFGGFDLDVAALDLEAVFISPNKCLESVPGLGISIVRRASLEAAEGRSPSGVLDLHAQWKFFQEKGWWRTTPPTHVVAALGKAIERHKREGGCAPRLARYTRNWRRLVDGMRQRGFRTLLPDDVAAPIIATFLDPTDPNYSFPKFYAAMEKRGLVIFAGRLTAAGTFRIGCMGDIEETDIAFVLETIDEALAEIGVSPTAPDAPAHKDGGAIAA
jgi:2-aminoethylphosphonate-pyruvate transaminase